MRQPVTAQNASGLQPIGRVQFGWITRVAFSPDGRTLAVAGSDGVGLFVNQIGGLPTHTLHGHNGHVKGAAFSPDGRTIATIASDTSIILWDLSPEEPTMTATLYGHTDSVDAVTFSPDGQMLVSGSADGELIFWEVGSGRIQHRVKAHLAEISGLVFAGDSLVSGSRDGILKQWSIPPQGEGQQIGTHYDWVRDVQTNRQRTQIASAGKDGIVKVLDAATSETLAAITAHEEGADCAAFSPDGRLLATGGRDNLVCVWDLQAAINSQQLGLDDALVTLEAHRKPVLTVAFNPAGTLLASGSGDNSVALWAITEV